MKHLVILALVAVGGYLAYQNFPGLRTAAQNKLDEFQSWSEEDRKNDPVGVIEYAKGQLEKNIAKFQSAVGQVDENKTKNEATPIQMQVADMRTAMDKLDAQKATIQQASLTDAADAVLADVKELVEGTTKMASSGDLLSLDELTQIEDKAKAVKEAADRKEFEQNDNRDFLLNG